MSSHTVERPEPGLRGPERRAPAKPKPWWRSWMFPLAAIIIWFLVYVWPPYLTLDPDQANIPNLQRDNYPLHYPFLVAHITFGTIAIVLVPLQIWPWLRRRKPLWHKWVGRVAVFAGVLPAGVTALLIMPFSGGPPGDAVASILWLATTVHAFRMARRRRFAEHRRFMIYCFALTTQIIWGRVWFLFLPHLPGWDEETRKLAFETTTWLPFVINLLAAQFYLEYTARKRRKPAQVS